jgi:hypothetical protein
MPTQRKKILPLLDSKSKTRVENILDQYKRTYKNKLPIKFVQEGSGCEREV